MIEVHKPGTRARLLNAAGDTVKEGRILRVQLEDSDPTHITYLVGWWCNNEWTEKWFPEAMIKTSGSYTGKQRIGFRPTTEEP